MICPSVRFLDRKFARNGDMGVLECEGECFVVAGVAVAMFGQLLLVHSALSLSLSLYLLAGGSYELV